MSEEITKAEISIGDAKAILVKEQERLSNEFVKEYNMLCEKYKLQIGANLIVSPK